MLRLDRTITNYDNKLADRVFTLGLATNAPKFTISAALEGWRRDDSVEEKKNPTPYFRLSVSVDNSALAQAGLRNMRWMQIGRTDRYRTQDAQRPSNDGATFGVINKFPTEDAKKSGGVPLLLRARETPGDLLEQAFINVCLFS